MRTVLLLALVATPLSATNWYVLDGGAGAFDCTDWANACDDLNDVTYARGDTVYIADGAYAGHTFNLAESGSTIVTFKKAIESDHGTDTGWSTAYGDGQATFNGTLLFQTSYWTIDGQVGYGAPWWKDYTAYGMFVDISGAGSNNAAVSGGGATVGDITLRHLEIQGANNGTGTNNDSINFPREATGDYTFSYLYLHAVNRVHFYIDTKHGAMELLVEYVFAEGNGLTGPATGEHSEVAAIRNTDVGTVRWSVFTDHRSTGGWQMDGATGWKYYGNVFWWRTLSGLTTSNHGVLGGWSWSDPLTGTVVCNNTIYSMDGGSAGAMFAAAAGSGHMVQNNLWVDSPNNGIFDSSHSYNAAYNGDYNDLIANESNGQILGSNPLNDPDNGDFTLTFATEHGDSTGVCASYNTDMDGNTRGADGTWDRGAFELNEGVPQALRVPIRLTQILWTIFGALVGATLVGSGIILLTRIAFARRGRYGSA